MGVSGRFYCRRNLRSTLASGVSISPASSCSLFSCRHTGPDRPAPPHHAPQIHTIAATIGGMAADWCLKLIIDQFTPCDNTLVFDGVHGIAATFAA